MVNINPYEYGFWSRRFAHQLYPRKFQIDGWPIVYIYLNPDYAHGTVTPLKPGRCLEYYCGIDLDKYNQQDLKSKDDLWIEALYKTLCFTDESGLTNDREAIDSAYKNLVDQRENATYIRLVKKSKGFSAVLFYTINMLSNIYVVVREEKTKKIGSYKALGIGDAEDVSKLCAKLTIVQDELVIQARPSVTEKRYSELTSEHSSKTIVSISKKCMRHPLPVILDSNDFEVFSVAKLFDCINAGES